MTHSSADSTPCEPGESQMPRRDQKGETSTTDARPSPSAGLGGGLVRAGARLEEDLPDSGEEMAVEVTDELPLIVWLRGHEPWCGEFSLEAEDVMRQLGIKRSRLTQISGRELRVGRIRRGRYISPLYRPSDVEAYLAWTRSPATHRQAAAALDAAGEKLSEAGEKLAGELNDRLGQALDEATERTLTATAAAGLQVERSLRPELAAVRASLDIMSRQQAGAMQLAAEAARRQQAELARVGEAAHVATTTTVSLSTDLRELLVAVRQTQELLARRLDGVEAAVTAGLQEVAARFDRLEAAVLLRQDALGGGLDALNARLELSLQQQESETRSADVRLEARLDSIDAALETLPELLEVHAARLAVRSLRPERLKERRRAEARRRRGQ